MEVEAVDVSLERRPGAVHGWLVRAADPTRAETSALREGRAALYASLVQAGE